MSANFTVSRFAVVATVVGARTTVNGPFGQQAAEQFCVAAVATGKLLDFKIIPWDELDANLATKPAADLNRDSKQELSRRAYRAGLGHWSCVSVTPEIWVRRDGKVCHASTPDVSTSDALTAFDLQYPIVLGGCEVDSK